ncbi:MAG: PAS domain S-box protein [Balneolaceae bacterium]|nr:PAS domain S-box protein [Balneolaceae bacterium]
METGYSEYFATDKLFDMMPGLALLADAHGRLMRVNDLFYSVLGYEKREAPEDLAALCAPGDREKWERTFAKAMEEGGAEVTLRLVTSEEGERWYRLQLQSHTGQDGKPFLLIAGSAVTHRVRAEQRLHTRQAILSSLFRNAGAGMVLMDRGGRILEVNPTFVEMFGYGEEELIGRNIDRLLAPEGESPDTGKEVTSRAGTAGSTRYRPGVVTKNGTPLAVLEDEAPVTGQEGANLCYRIYTDVTSIERSRSLAEGSAQEQKALLMKTNHRVMNNLNLATGFLQLQLYETDDSAVRQALTDTVVRIKSLAMIHDLFRNTGSRHRVDMQDYLDNLVVFLSQVRDRSGQAEVECRAKGLHMDVELAVPCVLLVNEVAGLILEQSGASAGLRIELTKEGKNFNLEMSERGGTVAVMFDKEKNETLRQEVVQALLRQLDAQVEQESERGINRLSIRFPDIRRTGGADRKWPEFGLKK